LTDFNHRRIFATIHSKTPFLRDRALPSPLWLQDFRHKFRCIGYTVETGYPEHRRTVGDGTELSF